MRSPATASTAAAIAAAALPTASTTQPRAVRQRLPRPGAGARPSRTSARAHRGARVHGGERRAKAVFESGPGAVARDHGAALASGGAGFAGGVASAGGGRAGSSVISIRRFFWRPSGVSFVAIGTYWP